MTASELAIIVDGSVATTPAMAAVVRGFAGGVRLGAGIGVSAVIGVGPGAAVELGVGADVGAAVGVALALGAASAQAPVVAVPIIDTRSSRLNPHPMGPRSTCRRIMAVRLAPRPRWVLRPGRPPRPPPRWSTGAADRSAVARLP